MYGKQTETAIAALTCLAEVYDQGRTRLSAAQIAKSRSLQPPSVAKALTTLSQAGLVQGIPGPGGGYWLAKSPNEITLFDAYKLYEREDLSMNCPFGGGTCGSGEPCAIHHKLVRVQEAVSSLLKGTSLQEFRTHSEQGDSISLPHAINPAQSAPTELTASAQPEHDSDTDRESYRATLNRAKRD